jgi:hypothetical protein
MSINCKTVGVLPNPVAPDDEHKVEFDIIAWLGTDIISTVAYSAVDEWGTDATADVLVIAKHSNTDTVIKPYIKGKTANVSYTVKCVVTANNANASKKTFYVKWFCREVAS